MHAALCVVTHLTWFWKRTLLRVNPKHNMRLLLQSHGIRCQQKSGILSKFGCTLPQPKTRWSSETASDAFQLKSTRSIRNSIERLRYMQNEHSVVETANCATTTGGETTSNAPIGGPFTEGLNIGNPMANLHTLELYR